MKIAAVFEELQKLAKQIDVTIRPEKGSFSGGYCILHKQKVIVINKGLAVETKVVVLSHALAELGILSAGIEIKPALLPYLEKERKEPIVLNLVEEEQSVGAAA